MAKYNKYIKMTIYSQPGVGKSTWVSKAPNVLILATDGNAEWLGLPEENSVQLQNWEDAAKKLSELNTEKYDKFDTIAVDLVEDLYSWCEQYILRKLKISALSDLPYGRAYDELRKTFFSQINKLFTLKKHIILISHEIIKVEKDRRGVETYHYYPSNIIPLEKKYSWIDIEGKCRYFLRAYVKAEEGEGGKLIKKRYLSICPKENEFGISRGFDESNTPEDIPLDWNGFCNIIGVKKISDDKEVQPESLKNDLEEDPTKQKVIMPSVAKPTVQPRIVTKPIAPAKPAQAFVPQTEAIPTPLGNIVNAVSDAKPTASAPQAATQAEKLAKLKAMLANRKK